MPRAVGQSRNVRLAAVVTLLCSAGCLFHFDRNLAPGQLTGKAVVRDAQSKLVPVAGASVVLEGSGLAVTADSRGIFSITGLPAGTYAIDVSAGVASGTIGLRLQGISIPVSDGLDLGQIELGAVGAIPGTVTLGGAPAPEGGVAAVAGLQRAAISGGSFLLPSLLPGDYSVAVLLPADPGAIVSPPATVHVTPGATVSTSFGLAITDTATAGAVQGSAELAGATSNTGVDVQFSGGGPDLTPDGSGHYSSQNVPPGIYTVTASLGGFVSVSVPDVIVGNGTTNVPGITLFSVGTAGLDGGVDAGFGCVLDSDCPSGLVCILLACVAPVDAGVPDAGAADGGVDAGSVDGGGDAGPVDAGPIDAGPIDAGPIDAGPIDAGTPDAGSGDAGQPDAGVDAGPFDAGPPVIRGLTTNAMTFSEVAGFNHVTATFDVTVPSTATATIGSKAMVCGGYQAASPSFTCTYRVTGNEGAGAQTVAVIATNAAGQDTASTSVSFDFTPLELTASTDSNPVNALTESPTLTVSSSKPLASRPDVAVTPVGLPVGHIVAGTPAGGGNAWIVPLQLVTPVAGMFTLTATGTDDVGHTGSAQVSLTVNTVPPSFSNIAFNGVSFSAVNGFNQVVLTFNYTDLLDAAASDLSVGIGGFTAAGAPLTMTCGAWQATLPNYTCTYAVTGTELAGDATTPIATLASATLPVNIAGTDSVGNQHTASPDITLDFQPPGLTEAPTITLIPAPNRFTTGTPAACAGRTNPLSAVTAATICTDIQASFSMTEALGSDPIVTAASGAITFQRTGVEGASYTFDGTTTVPGTPPDSGEYSLRIVATDIAGNTASMTLEKPTFQLDTTPPAAPATAAGGPVTYVRVPWGSSATNGSASFSVSAAAGAAEPGSMLLAYDAPSLTANVLGRNAVAGDGSSGSFALTGGDRPVVWLATVDEAGNESPVAAVHNVSWTASYNGKVAGSTTQNPHVMLAESASLLAPATGGTLSPGGTVFGAVDPALDPASELGSYAGLYPGAGAPSATTSGPSWVGPVGATLSPPSRQLPAMAYDSARGVTVLFGGLGSGDAYLGDTWEWNGAAWKQLSPPVSPPGRSNAAMAYDAARGVVLLFGGGGAAGSLSDTWEWDGTHWTQLTPRTSPPGLAGHAMAYDAARSVILLFGGETAVGAQSTTWEWDGTNWTQLSPVTSPSARYGHALAYDEQHGETVLFGGFDGSSNQSDTWVWDGTTWTQQTASGPSPRAFHALAYDAARAVTVLFGGDGDGLLSDTWEWDGTTWAEPFVGTSPAGREEHAMAYDAAHGTTVLFGGTSDGLVGLNETWLWNGRTWVQPAPPSSVPARMSTAMVFDTARSISVLFGGIDSGSNLLGDTWAFDGIRWTPLQTEGSPSAREGQAMAYDSTRSVTVLFGGEIDGAAQSDTWEGDGSSWSDRSSVTIPPARWLHCMTYDARYGVTLLFGGFNGTTALGDMWEWNGSNWVSPFTVVRPAARSSAAMAYDPVTARTVLFGGEDGSSNALGDTWEWNGTSWSQISPATSPSARYGHGMSYDTTLGSIVLFGGYDGISGTPLNDTWTFNGTTWTQITPRASPPARFSFAMAYDTARGATVIFGGSDGQTTLGDAYVLPSGVTTSPADVAEFDFAASGESFSSVSLEQVSLNVTAGGTGYGNPGPSGGGTAANGVALAAWSSGGAGSWRVLESNGAGAGAPAPLSYTTSTAWEARSYALSGPWQTVDFTVFPLEPTGNGSGPGALALADPELNVQYVHAASACTSDGDGGCLCASDETQCGSSCSDTTSDPQNCGGCAGSDGGTVCSGGAWCVNGACSCPGTEQLCNGVCTDTNSDPQNCGGCNNSDAGTACAGPFSACVQGQCVAPAGCTPAGCLLADAGPEVCNLATGQCAQCNTNADCACPVGATSPFACAVPAQPFCDSTGSCVQCLSDGDCAHGLCADGTCQSCPDAGINLEVACSGVCTNTSTDARNCGGCGVVCPNGQGCSGGRCFAP